MTILAQFLLVGLGGALGAASRFGISQFVGLWFKGTFPAGTLIANLLGCLLIGVLLGSGQDKNHESLRLGFGVGFLGALTTFSTFGAETHRHLTTEGEMLTGMANIGLNVTLGLVAVFIGMVIGKKLVGTDQP